MTPASSLAVPAPASSSASDSTEDSTQDLARADSQTAAVGTTAASSGPQVLAPGDWLRVVCGFEAPFGFDGMPTVLG